MEVQTSAGNPVPDPKANHNPLNGSLNGPLNGKFDLNTEASPTDNGAENEPGMLERIAVAYGRDVTEAKSYDIVDKADEQVDRIFKAGNKASPAYRAIWDRRYSFKEFDFREVSVSPAIQKRLDDCIEQVRNYRDTGTLFGSDEKIPEAVLKSLGPRGYWGLRIGKEYGGLGLSFQAFIQNLEMMAQIDPTVAGLASIHGCIGAVDPLLTFGTPEQKQRYLPLLASGEKLSAFALTEPNAGSDLPAIRTRARLEGDHYLVTGEKLFISNSFPERVVGLVCLIDDKPAVLIAELPAQENETFKFNDYSIYALRHLWNRGMVFNNFPVPKENLLQGDGLTIAYHGLNLGRTSLCANAAGVLGQELADLVPWGRFRVTYGAKIGSRELVQYRMGHTAAYMIGCRAMAQWCAALLDQGYRGEIECIAAKNLGANSLAKCSIYDYMKTHGGRSFCKGHGFGDNVHDLLAPMIYEGEGDMLSMAFLKAIMKDHANSKFAPWVLDVGPPFMKGRIIEGIKRAIEHRGDIWKFVRWTVAELMHNSYERLIGTAPRHSSEFSSDMRQHMKFGATYLQLSAQAIHFLMIKKRDALQDRQLSMISLSEDLQKALCMTVAASWGAKQIDPDTRLAVDVFCQDLRAELLGRKAINSARYQKAVLELGKSVYNGDFNPILHLAPNEILHRYQQ